MPVSEEERNELILESLPVARLVAFKFHRGKADEIIQEFALHFESYFLDKFIEGAGESWNTFFRNRMQFFCLDYYRKRVNHPTAHHISKTGLTIVKSVSTETVINYQSDQQDPPTIGDCLERSYTSEGQERFAVRDMLKTLRWRQQKMLELYYVDGLNQREIAETLNVSSPLVSIRMKEAIEQLQEDLEWMR